jgi:hypothetical protein
MVEETGKRKKKQKRVKKWVLLCCFYFFGKFFSVIVAFLQFILVWNPLNRQCRRNQLHTRALQRLFDRCCC